MDLKAEHRTLRGSYERLELFDRMAPLTCLIPRKPADEVMCHSRNVIQSCSVVWCVLHLNEGQVVIAILKSQIFHAPFLRGFTITMLRPAGRDIALLVAAFVPGRAACQRPRTYEIHSSAGIRGRAIQSARRGRGTLFTPRLPLVKYATCR